MTGTPPSEQPAPNQPESVSAPRSDSAPRVEIVDVTPALAEAWLARNPSNRNLRRSVVEAYARDMRAKQWSMNGETVKFSASGQLLDGQHRLNAIVAAGVTVPTVVVRGLTGQVMETVDAGVKRSYSDALKLRGEINAPTLAAVARRAVMWDRGHLTNTGSIRPTPLEMSEFIADHPQLRTSAELASRLASRERLPASVIGLCHYLFAQLDADAAGWFLLRVADGLNLSEGDPIAVLRDRIARLRIAGGRINETVGLALTIRAWNAYRDGAPRTKLQLPKGGLTNENFPVPH